MNSTMRFHRKKFDINKKSSKEISEESDDVSQEDNISSQEHQNMDSEEQDNKDKSSTDYMSDSSQGYLDEDTERYISFEETYNCHPLSLIGKSHLEHSDQIILPESAFERLLYTRVDYPMLFQILNEPKGRVSHCGVSEFTAEKGSVFLPKWMMENLQLQEGDPVNLKNVSLERGTYIKLQPHSMDFLGILNLKAALEETLSSKFFCLTSGDTIMINHNSKNLYVNILETKPSPAVCIIDADCEIDFAPPLDYKDPKKLAQPANEETGKEGTKFRPFTGLARRLDGKPLAELASPKSSDLEEMEAIDADTNMVTDTGLNLATESELRSYKRSGKMVFSPLDHQNKLWKEHVKGGTPKKEQLRPFTGRNTHCQADLFVLKWSFGTKSTIGKLNY